MRAIWTALLMVFVVGLVAAPVSMDRAQQVAGEFLAYKHLDRAVNNVTALQDRGVLSAYVVQVNNGYVVVTPDDRMTPILAYSVHNGFDFASDNPLSAMIQADIALRTQWLDDQGITSANAAWSALDQQRYGSRTFQQWPADGSTSTDGWILTHWTQTGVYNSMCPLDTGEQRSVVGCVATAMAQIINFQKYIGGAQFSESDSYSYGWGEWVNIDDDHVARDFPSFSELSGYLTTLDQHYTNGVELTSDDLAALNFACGISVQMSYSSSGSGAYTQDAAQAFLNKFNYTSAQWHDYSNSLLDILADDARHMRPCELGIYQDGYTEGHAINCDGYNTDDYYHLNFGWGQSDSSCWYSLPSGMPSNYTILNGAVTNIEGGTVPVEVQGTVSIDTGAPAGTYIRLVGPWTYEVHITETNGSFTIPAVYPGTYTATATYGGRLYYDSEVVTIDATHHVLTFDLGNYEAISGNVQADISVTGAPVLLYNNTNTLLAADAADASGAFSFPDQYPGDYLLSASLPGGYWGKESFAYSLDQQSVNLPLTHYDGQEATSWATAPTAVFSVPDNFTISCGIKLTTADGSAYTDQAITGVRFKAPTDATVCTLVAQVWDGNNLMSSKPVTDFSAGEWVNVEFDRYVPILTDNAYYVGYRITPTDGQAVWHDNGPRVAGKGAYICTTSWVELTATGHNYNFCIDALTCTNDFATISGTVDVNLGSPDLTNVIIHAGNYTAHANADGTYSLTVPAGEYTLSATLLNYLVTTTTTAVTVTAGQNLTGQDLLLTRDPSDVGEGTNEIQHTALLGCFPNPFNPETTVRYQLSEPAQVTLNVYNIRGQKVTTLINVHQAAGQYNIRWDGRNEQGQSVGNGVYFFNLLASGKGGIITSTHKAMLLK